jgi:hypothetical protein
MSGYVKLYELDFIPNVRVPVITPRMKMMLTALDNGGIVELMEVMYSVAETDYELSDPSRAGGHHKSLRGSMEVMLKDREVGEYNVLDLLKSMHINVIRACIDNTIGHRYRTSAEFRELFHEVDSCSGIYGYTILVEGEAGEFLNSNQIKVLSRKIEGYGRSEGMRNNNEAVEIDEVYGGVDFDPVPTRNGARLWLNPAHTPGYQNKTVLLGTGLRNRTKIDAVGTTPQFQSPMAVGFSNELKKRMSHHAISMHLTNTTHTWGLVLSVLKVMNINVAPVSVVLLKIWNDKHRALGEILITMLTSSLVEDGGLNPKQAGMNLGPHKHVDYAVEEHIVFVEKQWLAVNNVTTKAEMERRLETLSHLNGTQRESIVSTQNEINDARKKIEDGLKADEALLRRTKAALEDREAQQKIVREEMYGRTKAMENELNFLNELSAWKGSL